MYGFSTDESNQLNPALSSNSEKRAKTMNSAVQATESLRVLSDAKNTSASKAQTISADEIDIERKPPSVIADAEPNRDIVRSERRTGGSTSVASWLRSSIDANGVQQAMTKNAKATAISKLIMILWIADIVINLLYHTL